ncbi:MAG: phosphatase PAP2 family protein [Patescibacteria group bacterium]
MNLDLYIFNLIRKTSGKWPIFDFFMVFFAVHLSYLLFVFFLFFVYSAGGGAVFFLPVLIALFSRFLINETIYLFYKRKRPPDAIGAETLIKTPKHPSFPSGHASFFFGLSFAVASYNMSLGIFFGILSFLISFSRVFVGVHWPSDILAGMIAGIISSFLVYYLYSSLPWIFFNL